MQVGRCCFPSSHLGADLVAPSRQVEVCYSPSPPRIGESFGALLLGWTWGGSRQRPWSLSWLSRPSFSSAGATLRLSCGSVSCKPSPWSTKGKRASLPSTSHSCIGTCGASRRQPQLHCRGRRRNNTACRLQHHLRLLPSWKAQFRLGDDDSAHREQPGILSSKDRQEAISPLERVPSPRPRIYRNKVRISSRNSMRRQNTIHPV